MGTQAIRINARLVGEDARLFRDVQKLERRSTSGLLRAALREYSEKRVKPRKSAWQIMSESGLIGCIKDAPPDLSTNKKYLHEYLARKHPQHMKDKV